MNKITHEGNDYEVLTLDPESIKQITHARLAGGKVVDAEIDPVRNEFCCVYANCIWLRHWEDLGIQPLKLLERKPVEFTDTFAQCVDGKWYPVYSLDDGFGYQRCEQKEFRCVEVTK